MSGRRRLHVRTAARTDANHYTIIKAFEQMGCTVKDVHQLALGFDLLVGYGGLTMPVEVKDGDKPLSARKMTKNERDQWNNWTGGARLVENLDDVQKTVAVLRHWHKVLCEGLGHSPVTYRSELR